MTRQQWCVALSTDPLNSQTVFIFEVSPYNVQTEDLLNANDGNLTLWDINATHW